MCGIDGSGGGSAYERTERLRLREKSSSVEASRGSLPETPARPHYGGTDRSVSWWGSLLLLMQWNIRDRATHTALTWKSHLQASSQSLTIGSRPLLGWKKHSSQDLEPHTYTLVHQHCDIFTDMLTFQANTHKDTPTHTYTGSLYAD